ncbi:MAG: DMT family transporter [Myxococcaceae bacterium]
MTPQILLMLAVFLWSTAFVAIRVALHDYSPGSIALFRFFIAGLCLLIPYLKLKKRHGISVRKTFLLFLIGPIGIGGYSLLLNQSELQIPAGIASFVVSLTPVFSSLLAVFLLKERASPSVFMGLCVSLAGLLLIALGDIHNLKYDLALFLVVLAVFCGGIQSISQKILLKTFPVLELVTLGTWFAVFFLSIYWVELLADFKAASWGTTLSCVYLGVVPAFVAQWCWTHALSKLDLVHANTYLFAMPILTTTMGFVLLGEAPGLLGFLGGLLALLGAYVSVRQPL